MPVDQAAYRPWEGSARPGRGVVAAIAAAHIRRLFRLRLVRFLSTAILLFACIFASIFLYTQHLDIGERAKAIIQSQFGSNILAYVNKRFFEWMTLWATLMAAIAGAPLIAEDRRARALPLYFSRPLGHLQYVAGKFLTVAFFLGLLLLVPPLATFLVELALSTEEGVFLGQLPTLLRSWMTGLSLLVPLASLSLGISALNEKPNYASLATIGVLMLSFPLTAVLAHEVFRDSSWYALSPFACTTRIGAYYLSDTPPPGAPGNVQGMAITTAWLGVAGWTALGLALLVWRIRKVEVVE